MFKIEVAISGESLPVVSIRGQVEHMDKRWIHILQAHWCWSFYEGRTPPPQGLATSPLISPPGTTLRSWFPTHFFLEDSTPTSFHTDRVISPRKLQSLYVRPSQPLPVVLFIPGNGSMQLRRWTILQETFLLGAVSQKEADTLSSNIFNCPVKLTIIELIIEETIPDTLTESSIN